MPIELKMPALSPTMEEGTLAKWLVKEGDEVRSGDLIAEIETDKATMEFEAVDEGIISSILVAEGTEGVKVGAVIALIAGDGEEAGAKPAPKAEAPKPEAAPAAMQSAPALAEASAPAKTVSGNRIIASPLAKRLAAAQGIDLSTVKGSGPNGRLSQRLPPRRQRPLLHRRPRPSGMMTPFRMKWKSSPTSARRSRGA